MDSEGNPGGPALQGELPEPHGHIWCICPDLALGVQSPKARFYSQLPWLLLDTHSQGYPALRTTFTETLAYKEAEGCPWWPLLCF